MKTILSLTLSSIAAYFLVAWLRGRDITRRTQFDAANCVEYMLTEYPNEFERVEPKKYDAWINDIQARITK